MKTFHRIIAALPLSVLVLSLVACASVKSQLESPQLQTSQIMEEDKSQIALLLNKDLSVSVADTGTGERIKPCVTDPNYKAGVESNTPTMNLYERCMAPDKPKGEIFYQQTYNVTLLKGSCCAFITAGGNGYLFCTPRYPLEFINKITGQSCPDGQ